MPTMWEEEHLDPQFSTTTAHLPFQNGFTIGFKLTTMDFDTTLADFLITHYDIENNVTTPIGRNTYLVYW